MVNGITFSEQLITSENFAHFMYTFLNHANGVTKGCAISNANGKVYVQKGYFIVFGRMVQIIGTEEIASPDVVSGQLYCKVVFEVDLSKENTAEEFIQGVFKTLTSTASYPSVRQEDLDDTGKVYQMPWCQYIKQAGAIKDFRDLREILDLNSIWSAISSQNTQYKGEFDDYFAAQRSTILGMIAELEGQGYATTAEFNDLSAEVAETKKSVSDGKALVAAAITAKRVATAATDTFAKMAENIKKIVLGSGNAQPADVRKGKTFTNDEGIEKAGTMPEYISGTKGISCGLNDSGLYYYMGAGYWIQDGSGKSWVYMSRDDVAATIGLNPDAMLDSINVLGKQGKIQSMAGVTITPQTYAQTVWSAWKRLTGNVDIAAVPLPPANVIKKGYRYWIGGSYIDGTFEGYVPVATDLYLRGNNINGWTPSSTSTIKFETGQITIVNAQMEFMYGGKKLNLAGFSRLHIEGWFRHNYGDYEKYVILYASDSTTSTGQDIGNVEMLPQQTITNPTINFNYAATKYLVLRIDSRISGVIYRIWIE